MQEISSKEMQQEHTAPSGYAESTILSLSAKHEALLLKLAALDHAPAALKKQLTRLEDLQEAMDKHRISLESVKREKLDAKPTKGQSRKRLLSKSKNRTSSTSQLDDPREQLHADALRIAQAEIAETSQFVPGLESLTKEHEELQSQLDHIYESVFAGPTPEFPEEDDAELEVFVLEKERDEDSKLLESLKQSNELLKRASTYVLYVCKTLEHLRLPLANQKFKFTNESLQVIQRAQEQAQQVVQWFAEVKTLDPSIEEDLGLPDLADISTNYKAKQAAGTLEAEVRACLPSAKAAMPKLQEVRQRAQLNLFSQQAKFKLTTKKLRQAKHYLDSTRRSIFIDLAANAKRGGGSSTPPGLCLTPEDGSSDEEEEAGSSGIITMAMRDRTGSSGLLELIHDDEPPEYLPRTKLYPHLTWEEEETA